MSSAKFLRLRNGEKMSEGAIIAGNERVDLKAVFSYLLMVFSASWSLIVIIYLLGGLRTMAALGLYGLMMMPAISAFLVRKWITKEGFGDAGLRPNFRRGWRYYLIAWLLPLLVSGIILGMVALFGISKPDFTLQRFAQWMGAGSNVPSVPPYLWLVLPIQFLIGALFTTFFSFGEEFGWRGYLQKRIMPGKPVWAAVVTGIIWGVWHFPLNIQGYNFPDNRYLGLIVFPITTVFLSIIFGWLQNKSDVSNCYVQLFPKRPYHFYKYSFYSIPISEIFGISCVLSN